MGLFEEMAADSPVAMWKFNETSGTFDDFIGSLDLAVVSSITYAQAGPGIYTTNAITVGSSGSAKTTGNSVSPEPTNGTWEIWLKQTSVTTSSTPQTPWSAFANTGDNGGSFWIDNYGHSAQGVDGSLLFGMVQGVSGNSRISCALDQLLTVNVWTHCAWTWNEGTGTLKAYRNGVLDNTATSPSGARASSPGPIRFGSFSSTYSSQYWRGSIGPAAIYATDLSPTRLLAHYNAAFPIPLNTRYLAGDADGGPHRMVVGGGFAS